MYRFGPDGTTELLQTCNLSGLGEDYVTGNVSAEDGEMRCEFGSSWHSDGDTLVIEGECSDDANRSIVLDFVSSPGQNTEGATVEVASVDGDSLWDHYDLACRWVRCSSPGCELDAGCAPIGSE